MKSIIALVALYLIYTPLISQSDRDSLYQIWNDSSQHDTTRLNAAYDLAVALRTNNPDSAIWFSEWEYYYASQNQYQSQRARALNTIGIILTYTDELLRAEDYLNRARKMYLQLGDTSKSAFVDNNLGNLFLRGSHYVEALRHYQNGYETFEKLGQNERAGIILGNISLIYMEIEEYDLALKNLQKSLQYAIEAQNQVSEVYKRINIAIVQRELGNHKLALEENYIIDSLLEEDNYRLRGILNENLAISLIALGDTTKATQLFMKGIEMNRVVNNKKQLSNCLINLGGIVKSSFPDSAISLASEALEVSKSSGNLDEICRSSELLYELYKSKNQTTEALEMLELFETTRDSIDTEGAQKELIRQELQREHNIEKQQQEQEFNEILDLEKRNQRRTVIFLFFSGLLVVSVFLAILKRRRRSSKIEIDNLMNEITKLKENTPSTELSINIEEQEIHLDKSRLEDHIGAKLNPSDWGILQTLCKDPFILNKDLADQNALSLEGASSSLRKMYRLFKISGTSNKKIVLVKEAIRISLDN